MKQEPITRQAYAKINLTLEILGALDDGYHQIVSVMQQLELHDDIILKPRFDGKITVTCMAPGVPLDKRNLAWKAVELLRKKHKLAYGVGVEIKKRIPIAGGMAGGSSDAAAVLDGLNEQWELNLPLEELAEIGEEIGMDVPFCVLGGTALATDKGQNVEPLPAAPLFHVVVANPGIQIATPDAYKLFDSVSFVNYRHGSSAAVAKALQDGNRSAILSNLYNDFELAINPRFPAISKIKDIMLANGAPVAMLSGSGPSVFCLVNNAEHAKQVAIALKGSAPIVITTQTRQLIQE